MKLAIFPFQVIFALSLVLGATTNGLRVVEASALRASEPQDGGIAPSYADAAPKLRDASFVDSASLGRKPERRDLAVRIELCALKRIHAIGRYDYHTIWRFPEYANNLTLNKKAVRGDCMDLATCKMACQLHHGAEPRHTIDGNICYCN